MARTGILYFDVASAAARLVADGVAPTVDGVRAALGGTGSKSTLAPLLKRWKAEHQQQQVQAESDLPPALLQTVRALHAQLRDAAGVELASACAEHAAAQQIAATQIQEMQTRYDALQQRHAEQSDVLADTAQRLAALEHAHQQQTTTLAMAQADLAGTQQRLADRAAELANLVHQLQQTRAQFDHFQQASAAQRNEERSAADQRIARAEQESAMAARQLAGLQAALAQQQSTVQQQLARQAELIEERDALRAARRADADDLARQLAQKQAEVLAERARAAQSLREAMAARDSSAAQLPALQGQLMESRMAFAAQERETRMLGQQLHKLHAQADKLAEEKLVWIRERVALEELLRKDGRA